ncbi:MAG: low temperature requirement protein [Microbacteriaceae bacterium]|nr:low temperature requirement protein [Microbacteriaceae bacterium]
MFELLFDLVFVFAFTQVTDFMANDHSAVGVLRAITVLATLWIGWASYGWLSNQSHVDEGVMRIGFGVAMATMFVVALVIPESYKDLPGGLSGPLVFVIAYFIVRLVHIVLYVFVAGGDVLLRRQVLRTSLSVLATVAILVVGALVGGPAQTWIWLGSVVVDGVLIYATSAGGNWRIDSASHWSERHSLVVILALGESVVAIGVGAAHEPISAPILLGSALAIVLTISLWWLYFDTISTAAERVLAEEKGQRRAAMATDAYTYIHFLLILGIVISALGVEIVVAHAVRPGALGFFAAIALFGGTSLYLAGHAAFWRRVGGTWKVFRIIGATLLLAVIPLGAAMQPLAALAAAVAIVVATAVAESIRYSRHRAEIRAVRPD